MEGLTGWCLLRFMAGPGLAIRVICAEEPYMERDFAETRILLKIITDYANASRKVGLTKH